MKNHIHIHMISDSTGETVNSVIRSAMSMFEDVEYEEHTWSLVRTAGQMERVMKEIDKNPGPVLYTIIDRDVQAQLIRRCRNLRVPCIPVLDKVTKEFSAYLGIKAHARPGRQYELDEEYFNKMDAIHYSLAHDDGQETETLDEADIIIVGPSRTSKTPTCVYLSNKGIFAANVPFVHGIPLPETLFEVEKPFIIGLTTSPDRLSQIRKSRLLSLNEGKTTDYVDEDKIKEELLEAKRIYARNKWPVIDVTRKSIEETSANILNLYNKFTSEREAKKESNKEATEQ